MFSFKVLVFWIITIAAFSHATITYEGARNTRLMYGHDAAVSLHQQLLLQNTNDKTAATLIAASEVTPLRQDRACPSTASEADFILLKQALENYDNKHVQQLFGINEGNLGFDSQGPLFIRPVTSGSTLLPPFVSLSETASMEDTSLVCLVSLFLLGFAVPRQLLEENLIGGRETIHVMEKLGLAFPWELDSSWIVPYVHIFPMDVRVIMPQSTISKTKTIRLVTDLHPSILGQTSVGTTGDGAVMYIGPDSLALVQHLPLDTHINGLMKRRFQQSNLQILDLCTGSGVQAIATLVSLEECSPDAKAVCVDLNERALRFARFNVMLNCIDPDRVDLLKLDLLGYDHMSNESLHPIFSSEYHQTFDIILSNPPFIPVPSTNVAEQSSNAEYDVGLIVQRKYGLFSSGGATGEIILSKVLELSSNLLKEDGGLLAIVSEFMNPPMESEGNGEGDTNWALIMRLQKWWGARSARGMLFTNQRPLTSDEYSRRRSSSEDEYDLWRENLRKCKISCVSPGLLFLMTHEGEPTTGVSAYIKSEVVPKTDLGSIWTPHNKFAMTFTRELWAKFLEST